MLTASYYAEDKGMAAETAAELIDYLNPLSLPQDILDIGNTIIDINTVPAY